MSSGWTIPVPENPKLHPNSDLIAARVAAEQAKGVNPFSIHAGPCFFRECYEHPVYHATENDPIRTYHLPSFGGSWKPPIEGYKAHIPATAAPANGTDSSLCVIQPDGTICDSYQTDLSTPGIVRAGWADFSSPTGHGTCTAGQFALNAGIITPQELVSAYRRPNTKPIAHALTSVHYWHSGIVGMTDREVQPNQRMLKDPSVPRFGEHLYVDMTDSELRTKPRHVRPIIKAMRDYGLYVGDTGGNEGGGATNGGLKVDSSNPYGWTRAGSATRAPTTGNGDFLWDIRPHVDWARQLKVIAQ